MGMRLNIYEKSPYEGLGKQICEGGSYGWRIEDEIYKCDVVNKIRDRCDLKGSIGCIVCDCSYDDYIKLTYDQLSKIDKDILSKNTNFINAFCYNKKNCKLDVECGLDCLKVKHRNCIWINFS